jgi:hypothetical protein
MFVFKYDEDAITDIRHGRVEIEVEVVFHPGPFSRYPTKHHTAMTLMQALACVPSIYFHTLPVYMNVRIQI